MTPVGVFFICQNEDKCHFVNSTNMARSALCPVHFLFFVLRAGGHNGVQLGILREAVNKRDGGIPEEQQPFAGIGMGHIGKLVGAAPKLFG